MKAIIEVDRNEQFNMDRCLVYPVHKRAKRKMRKEGKPYYAFTDNCNGHRDMIKFIGELH